MGYELGLDQPPQRPLPKDRLRALEVLVSCSVSPAYLANRLEHQNRERTWFQLAAFDRRWAFLVLAFRARLIRLETVCTVFLVVANE